MKCTIPQQRLLSSQQKCHKSSLLRSQLPDRQDHRLLSILRDVLLMSVRTPRHPSAVHLVALRPSTGGWAARLNLAHRHCTQHRPFHHLLVNRVLRLLDRQTCSVRSHLSATMVAEVGVLPIKSRWPRCYGIFRKQPHLLAVLREGRSAVNSRCPSHPRVAIQMDHSAVNSHRLSHHCGMTILVEEGETNSRDIDHCQH